jgi:hypothetical protein
MPQCSRGKMNAAATSASPIAAAVASRRAILTTD